MVTIVKRSFATQRGCVNDIADQADASKPSENKNRVYLMCQASARLGMFYSTAGVPDSKPIAVGAFCMDTTNDDVYVCTDRDTPTWTKLAE